MLRKINVAWIALLALPLLLTGCQSEEQTPTPEPAPEPAPLAPYLSKMYKNGLLSREYTYEGPRPVRITDYNDKGELLKTATLTYDGTGKVTLTSVRSAAFPHQEEDRAFTYNSEGLVTKVEYTAVNNARYRQSGEGNLVAGEMFAYTTFEYNTRKELTKSSNFVKYSTSIDWPEANNFAVPIYYMTYEYDAAGNPVKRTGHSILPPGFEPQEFIEEHTYTFDTQKNPQFYSFLFEEGVPNPRFTKHNVLTRRSGGDHPFWSGHHQDYIHEYNADGFPTKSTLAEGGGHLSRTGDRTIVYTYEYGMRAAAN